MQWLDEEIEVLATSNDWQCYRVKVGHLEFCICLRHQSAFNRALDAFFCVDELNELPDGMPTIWVVEAAAILDRCASKASTALSLAQERGKLSSSKLFLNYDPARGLLKYFNAVSNRGLFFAEDLAKLPSWEWFSPLKEFVHLFALEQGAWLAHAASLSAEGSSGLLLVGPGGSGKSTTCAHLIEAGYQTCGDDYVLLRSEDEGVFAHAIYRTIKLLPQKSLGNGDCVFNGLRQSKVAETGKSVYFLSNEFEHVSIVRRMPVKQIMGLRLADLLPEPIRLTELAYTHFAMSSHGQIPVWLDRSLSVSREIFERLPKQMIEVRRDVSGLQASSVLLREVLG